MTTETPTQPTAVVRTRRFDVLGGHLVLALIAVFSLVPILWMYVTALRPRDDVLSQSVLPSGVSLDNLRAAADLLPLGGLIGNIALMAVGVAAFQLFTALLASYAFGR